MNRAANALLFISGVAFGTIFSALIVSAWTGPTQIAPNGNVSAPINVGTVDQIKNGGLGVNSLAVYGNAVLSGSNLYLNFGDTAGVNGYGVRDNAGTLEFKNTGGSWNNFTNSVLNVLGAGAVTLIKFSDGTTQTTAVGNYLTNGSVTSIKFSDGTTQSTASAWPYSATTMVSGTSHTLGTFHFCATAGNNPSGVYPISGRNADGTYTWYYAAQGNARINCF